MLTSHHPDQFFQRSTYPFDLRDNFCSSIVSILILFSFINHVFSFYLLFLLLGLCPLFLFFLPSRGTCHLSRTIPPSNHILLDLSVLQKQTRNTCKPRLLLHCWFPTSGSQSGSKSHFNRSLFWQLHAGEKVEWAWVFLKLILFYAFISINSWSSFSAFQIVKQHFPFSDR